MIRALVFVWLSTLALAVSPQTLKAVTDTPAVHDGLPWWVGPAVGLAIILVGWIVLKRKYPGTAAKVSADASAVGLGLHRLAAALEEKVKLVPAAGATTTEPAAPVADLQPALDLVNGKLAQIKAIVDA